jgi:hypothetical protein
MGPVVTPDQAAPRRRIADAITLKMSVSQFDAAVAEKVAQARAEERAACAADIRALDEAAALEVRAARAEERARVLAVIAQVRDSFYGQSLTSPHAQGWRDACDAITQALEGDE